MRDFPHQQYMIVHRASNLIIGVTHLVTSSTPAYKVVPVSEYVLEKYHHMLIKLDDGLCVDAGAFASISPSFYESLGRVR